MIYFIQEGKRGAIKIGHTYGVNIKRRFQNLQTAHCRVLHVLGTQDGTTKTLCTRGSPRTMSAVSGSDQRLLLLNTSKRMLRRLSLNLKSGDLRLSILNRRG